MNRKRSHVIPVQWAGIFTMDLEPDKFQSRDMVTLVLTDFSYGYYLLWIVFYIRNIKMNIIKSLCSQTER